MKTYVVDTHKKHLAEVLLISTYNTYFSMKTYVVDTQKKKNLVGASNEFPQHIFSWRNKKNIMRIPLLSGANLLATIAM